ncbi:helix-turn-helix transcriptional regulator [Sphingobium sp.]|uniref:helix-turn-helix transcriptional regulator n=1 Tax=Sphingobium sp. TaxID=1912891 RepID=UPI0028BD96C4|nr:helix-turn-helix transcriptional regulator [Sphingobium sp.]
MAALQDYSAAGIFTHDPFLSQEVVRRRVGEKGWLVVESNDCEVREDMCASEYWAFLSRYKIGVGGAIIKPITSDVFLVGALHGDYRPSDASIATVADEMGGVLDCAASRLMSVAIGALDQGNEISTVDALNGLVDRYRLSERDSAIVSLVKSGLLNKQIAHELSIPDYTVENHLRRIYRKLGVHNRSALLSLMFSRA